MGQIVREHMSKADLLTTLKSERAKLDSVLATIPDERMLIPYQGDWTVKDVIAHIAAYEKWMASHVNPALRPALPPPPPGVDLGDTDQRNQWFYELNKDRSLADVRTEAREVFDSLVSAIESRSEEDLNAPVNLDDESNLEPTTWDDEPRPVLWPLWRWVGDQAYEHYPMHCPDLEAWAKGA